MEWIKQNARLLALLVTIIFSIGAVAFTVGSAIQKSNDNKEELAKINKELNELPTPGQLEMLNVKLEALNVKLEFIIDMLKEQRIISDKQLEQMDKRIEKLEIKRH